MDFYRFVTDLGKARLTDRAFNQYAPSGQEEAQNRVRRANLRLYLEHMEVRRPAMLLIGEAPSYRGARLTGIPFLSETLMLGGVPTAEMFGRERGYLQASSGAKLSTEASASIVWETIGSMRPLPLLWNAFPFHPFDAGNPDSNRMPTRPELEIGRPFITRLIRGFEIPLIVAVGNHAHSTLDALEIRHEHVRHPSQGGKPKFVEGVKRCAELRA